MVTTVKNELETANTGNAATSIVAHNSGDARADALFATVHERIAAMQHRPNSTYRVQFNRFFTFKDALAHIDYIDHLGISDLYASPYFAANPESLHGYDIVDHNRLNTEIGTREEYDALVAELHRRGMFQILDIVPNHMGIGQLSNAWWIDVLENGRASIYAPYFDIEWEPLNSKLTNRVLLPLLGDQYGTVLERGELKLAFAPAEGRFWLNYWENVFPIAPRSYLQILDPSKGDLIDELGADNDAALEFQSVLTAIRNLPDRDLIEPSQILERNREKEVVKRRLAAVCAAEPRVLAHIQRVVAEFNGTPDDPRSYDLLDRLLEAQAYRLSFWRVAAEEINYRRFFDINELAAIRVDQPDVFTQTHKLILSLVASGAVNGLRIDHVDGLRDPAGYFDTLQRGYFLAVAGTVMAEGQEPLSDNERISLELALLERFDAARASDELLKRPLFVAVEKILARSEKLPVDWSVAGTTGYEFTNAVNGLFVNPAGAEAFDALYTALLDDHVEWADMAYASKKSIMRLSLASELNLLTNMLNRISQSDRHYRDFTQNSIRTAIREVIACFPVYRTYVSPEHPVPGNRDARYVRSAVTLAKRRNPAFDVSIFDFLRDILLMADYENLSEDARTARLEFGLKFQQVTGPVVAKGLEDTAFYVYNRLVSLNEVGGEPEFFGLSPDEFHKQQAERQRRWPASILTTSTHDTKRSEDVRARVSVLSERPKEWRAGIRRWTRLNRKHKRPVEGRRAPSANEEYFLYQTLLGVWPFEQDLDDAAHEDLVSRVGAYMRKALNEAKVSSSWVNTNEPYLAAVSDFIRAILSRDESNTFLPDFLLFAGEVAHYGVFNSLSQALLKITSPGVPDIYQGNEAWDFSLVDPDNRRPVDYDLRRRMLDRVEKIADAAAAAKLVDSKEDGAIKVMVTSRALNYRRDNDALYATGAYTPLGVEGKATRHIVAFARSSAEKTAITVAPVLTAGLAKWGEGLAPVGAVWSGSWLMLPGKEPGQAFRNIFTNEVIEARAWGDGVGLALEEVLAQFPVALLEQI